MKYLILGYSGSGKSSFSTELSKLTNIKETHLDKLYFNPNWIEVNKEEFESRIQEILKNNQWIIEGNYSRFAKNRLTDADIIYIFNFNRFKCFYNLIKRRIKYHKKVRESSADGCIEKLDFKFIWYALYTSRNKRRKHHYKRIIKESEKKVIVFKNHKQVSKYLKEFIG